MCYLRIEVQRCVQGNLTSSRRGRDCPGLAHYRCTFAADYAVTSTVQHPKTIYVREDAITPRLDAWITQVFEPDQLDSTCQLLAEAQEHDASAVA